MRINIAFGLLVAALASTTCDESLSKLAGPTPNLEPTFASIQQEIFETTDAAGRTSCVTCHTNVGRAPAGGINLVHDVAFDQLVNKAAPQKPGTLLVLPGDPANSYLVQKVEGTVGIVGRRMPFNGPPYLSDGQILILKRWIENGAPRN